MIKKNIDNEYLFSQLNQYKHDLVNVIRDRLGIDIHSHQINELYTTVIDACQMFDYDLPKYITELKQCSDQSPVIEHLIIGITVGETYFFRDKNQMKMLENEIFPEIISNKRSTNNLSLRIWSAGCASGEEIYTIAMMLNDLLPDIKNWNISLLGTDINTQALQKALSGIYSEWSMRSCSESIINKYFSREGNKYILSERIRRLVTFDYLNLNDDAYPSIFNGTNSQDLILCRNVLIYFDSGKITSLMRKLSACLVPDGYLLLGASDPIDSKAKDHQLHFRHNMLFSRMQPQEKPPTETKFTVETIKVKPAEPRPVITSSHHNLSTSVAEILPERAQIDYLLNTAQWQPLLNKIESVKVISDTTGFYTYARGTAYANLGNLTKATQLIEEALHIAPTNEIYHFTYALVLIENNKLIEAENELRKAIFLNNDLLVAHYQLGLLLLRNHKYEAGIKSLRNALTIINTKQANAFVNGIQGLSFANLKEVLEHELKVYSTSGNNEHDKEKTSIK